MNEESMRDVSHIKDSKLREILCKVEDRLRELFHDKLSDIILYGSYARNENTIESDIDIMALVNEDEESLKEYEDYITDIMVDLSLEYGVVLSLYTLSVGEFDRQVKVLPFLMNVQKEGITIYRSG